MLSKFKTSPLQFSQGILSTTETFCNVCIILSTTNINFISRLAPESSNSSCFAPVYSALHFPCFRTVSATLKKSQFPKHGSDHTSSQASIGEARGLWDQVIMFYCKNR